MGTEDYVVVKSKGGLFPHTHTLNIPKAAIAKPSSEGLLLTTSEEYSLFFKHKHQVRLSAKDLENIQDGNEVTVIDTDKGRHSFTIQNYLSALR